ncbi:MAG: preprotein translocase subunit SecY [Firmicutes bacterium]|nr:preprotein translocase subunit SecY [Bacillota bacterium]
MFTILKNAWKMQDLRKKIFYTFFIILIFRIGSVIPVPFIDFDALRASASTSSNDFFNYISVLTGGGLEYGAVFAMSVTPYINASIIMQLLTVAFPNWLGRIAKEEDGQRKIAKYTRVATVILGLLQGSGYYVWLNRSGMVNATGTFANVFAAIVIILCFTAGSAVMMWLGERIDEKGIGNGISVLLFAGIISRAPSAAVMLWNNFIGGKQIAVIGILVAFLIVIAFIVFMTGGERKIPIIYAKRVVGRKIYGGQNTHIPIKVNMSGVMPIIFASSFLAIPTMALSFMSNTESFWYRVFVLFSYRGAGYALLYLAMIIGFAYFYVTIQYDPVEMANNLRKNSGSVPGIRPGQPTADYFKKIIGRITLIGALFLGVIAILPLFAGSVSGINVSLGGTSVLIVVGVALDTVQSLESQMMMRHYKGFLD